ncbi:hypothetical protein ACFQ5D_09110 [Paenibacillus farraposensis]|uniref:Uncharacterized protein n=1 Tax=Paenibacillus farraposensis TaxID=2807095 RepID=A0ABW4DAP5_9BACL|nr:hypothetical protein [Paenibacillus farraposensis]MCC3379921.1 hypothetical protein [Paenibacillus farraposensis]
MLSKHDLELERMINVTIEQSIEKGEAGEKGELTYDSVQDAGIGNLFGLALVAKSNMAIARQLAKRNEIEYRRDAETKAIRDHYMASSGKKKLRSDGDKK